MNTADLDSLLKAANADACIEAFGKLNEKQRTELAPRARDWLKVMLGALDPFPFGRLFNVEPSEREKKRRAEFEQLNKTLPAGAQPETCLEAVRVAVLACCGFTDIKKFGDAGSPKAEHCYKILRSRKPTWLDKWMKFACAELPYTHWLVVRRLEKDKLAEAPADSNYWFAAAINLPESVPSGSVIEALEADPDLFQNHLWTMLENEVTVNALSIGPYIDRDRAASMRQFRNPFGLETMQERSQMCLRASERWKDALPKMAESGTISKERLVDFVLYGITRLGTESERDAGLVEIRLKWYRAIFDGLVLSNAERQRILPQVIGLMSSRNTLALQCAINLLTLYDVRQVPLEDLSAVVGNLFRIKGKEHALSALSLFKSWADSKLTDNESISLLIVEGLEHNTQEIQKKTLDILDRLDTGKLPRIRRELKSKYANLSGLLRERAEKLAGGYTDEANADVDITETHSSAPSCNQSLDELLARLVAVDYELRELAGIADAIAAANLEVSSVKPLLLETYDAPRLDDSNRIFPIDNIDDLMFETIRALSLEGTADDLERIFDGFSRLCDQTPIDIRQRLAPLNQKAREMIPRERDNMMASTFTTYLVDLVALVVAWTEKKVHLKRSSFWESVTMKSADNDSGPTLFLRHRMVPICERVARGESRQILCAPTHKGGWLDPRVLVDRMELYEARDIEIDLHDFVQALLRLTPDGRAQALVRAEKLSGEAGAALCYALGGERKGAMQTQEFWVAAARAREPQGRFDFIKERYPDLGADCGEPATYSEDYGALTKHDKYQIWAGKVTFVHSHPATIMRNHTSGDLTALMHCHGVLYSIENATLTMWPQLPESVFFQMTKSIYGVLDSQSSFNADRKCSILFDPDVNVSGMARPLIALGLACKFGQNSQFFEDVLIATIEDGRFDGAGFGACVAALNASGAVVFGRFARAFKNASRVSPLHLQVVLRMIEKLIGALPVPDGKPSVPLLELLYQLCLEAHEEILDSSARSYLENISTKGKAKDIATKLLKLDGSGAHNHRKAAALQALANRVERAERYQHLRNSVLQESVPV